MIPLAGDTTFEPEFIEALRQALRSGGKLLLHKRHAGALGNEFKQLEAAGSVEILPLWTNPATSRQAAISNARLARLVEEHVPVAVEGNSVQYQVNRTRRGWAIELIHNGGVIKEPDQPAVINSEAMARVRLWPRVAVRAARVWDANRDLPLGRSLAVTVPPGQSVFVELISDE